MTEAEYAALPGVKRARLELPEPPKVAIQEDLF